MDAWIKKFRKQKRKDEFYEFIDGEEKKLQEYKKKLIFERKKEIQELRKRISYLEMELEGMGIRDFELQKHEEIN